MTDFKRMIGLLKKSKGLKDKDLEEEEVIRHSSRTPTELYINLGMLNDKFSEKKYSLTEKIDLLRKNFTDEEIDSLLEDMDIEMNLFFSDEVDALSRINYRVRSLENSGKESDFGLLVRKADFYKAKKRSYDKTMYEAFMMDLWSNILGFYSNITKLNLSAPSFNDIDYVPENGMSNIFMTYCKGKGLNKIWNSNKGKVYLFDKNIRVVDLVGFYLGALNCIKQKENLLHGDYDLRHVLLNIRKIDHGLSVIDFEKSRKSNIDEVIEENEEFEKKLFNRFNKRSVKENYLNGFKYASNKSICVDNVAGKIYPVTLKTFKEKILKYVEKHRNSNGKKYNDVDFDIINTKVIYK